MTEFSKGDLAECVYRMSPNCGELAVILEINPYIDQPPDRYLHKDEYSCVVLFNKDNTPSVVRAKWLKMVSKGDR